MPSQRFGAFSPETMRARGHLKWAAPVPDVLGADVAEMDFGTAEAVSQSLHTAIEYGLLGYVPPALEQDLSMACADWQRSHFGWSVSADDVRVVPDVIRALHLAIEVWSRPGSPVIVPVPTYMPFLVVPGLLGRRIIQVEMAMSDGRYVYDIDALRSAYRQGGHLLLLCNPHNPLGRVLSADELFEISEVVDHFGGRVFADEIHAPVVYPPLRHIPYASLSATAAGHTITAVSASKGWNLAGLKCAQVILSNGPDRGRWSELGRLATDGTSILGIVAGIAAFRDGDAWLHAVLDYLDQNRSVLGEQLAQQLPQIGYRPPEGTYLGWLDCRQLGLSPAELNEFFRQRARVSVVDGAACGQPGIGFVRLNFATSQSILRSIVSRLSVAFAK